MADTTPLPIVVQQPASAVELGEARPRNRRWIVLVVVLLVVTAVLVVGFLIADSFAKTYAADYVRSRIVEVLKLDPATPIDVDLGSGSVILQALTGSINAVTVTADSIIFGDLEGSAQITAANVPLDSTQPVEKLDIVVTISEENVRNIAANLSGLELTSVELEDGVIRAGAELNLVVLTLPVAVDLLPSVKDGGITFDPQTVLLGEDQVSVADLRANPLVSAVAGDILQSTDVCVASYLPQAFALDAVSVVGSALEISINGDGTVLGDSSLGELGTCPEGD